MGSGHLGVGPGRALLRRSSLVSVIRVGGNSGREKVVFRHGCSRGGGVAGSCLLVRLSGKAAVDVGLTSVIRCHGRGGPGCGPVASVRLTGSRTTVGEGIDVLVPARRISNVMAIGASSLGVTMFSDVPRAVATRFGVSGTGTRRLGLIQVEGCRSGGTGGACCKFAFRSVMGGTVLPGSMRADIGNVSGLRCALPGKNANVCNVCSPLAGGVVVFGVSKRRTINWYFGGRSCRIGRGHFDTSISARDYRDDDPGRLWDGVRHSAGYGGDNVFEDARFECFR